MKKSIAMILSLVLVLGVGLPQLSNACTGIRLSTENGDVVYGRSMEWGAFDLNSRVIIVPRGYEFTGLTPDGYNGKNWRTKYGVVAIDMLEKDLIADGMNERGLTVGLFYHPQTAQYQEYQRLEARNTITAVDVAAYLLTQYATIDEVRRGLQDVRVVPVVEEALGIPVDAHWFVTDPSGESIVIEYLEGELNIFENPLGILTNSPSFDWHMTNIRSYINLSAVALPTKTLENLDFAPMGGGSGMIGLPGDFTPTSRFVRAVAWSQTARTLPTTNEAVYELFRILDNFNVPLGAAEGSDLSEPGTEIDGLRSTTLWTTAWDLSDRVLYFHTQHNRRVRMVDIGRINFDSNAITHITLDESKEQDIQDITP